MAKLMSVKNVPAAKSVFINAGIILFFNFLIIFGMNAQDSGQMIKYYPIGVFHTPLTPQTGAPRQGILAPEIKGEIEIYPEYRAALNSLELFEYIIVLYHCDRAKGWENIVNPPGSNPDMDFGLFATRTYRRPNPIGIAVIKLEKIDNGILYVSGIDAYEGTPVLDIKPYLPKVDSVKSSRNRQMERELGLPDSKK